MTRVCAWWQNDQKRRPKGSGICQNCQKKLTHWHHNWHHCHHWIHYWHHCNHIHRYWHKLLGVTWLWPDLVLTVTFFLVSDCRCWCLTVGVILRNSEKTWNLMKFRENHEILRNSVNYDISLALTYPRVYTGMHHGPHRTQYHPLPGYTSHHAGHGYTGHHVGHVSGQLLSVHQASFGYKEMSANTFILNPLKSWKKKH